MSNTTFAEPNDDPDFLNWMNSIIDEVKDFEGSFDNDDDFDYNLFFKGSKEFFNDSNWD